MKPGWLVSWFNKVFFSHQVVAAHLFQKLFTVAAVSCISSIEGIVGFLEMEKYTVYYLHTPPMVVTLLQFTVK